MESINSLPPALEQITIPTSFTPTQLVNAADCRLRVVFSAQGKDCPRLPNGPAAERGIVFHALLERAARGLLHSEGSPRQSVEQELSRLLVEAEIRLASKPETAYFSRLSDTVSRIEWHNLTSSIVCLGEQLFRRSSKRSTPDYHDRSKKLTFLDIQGPGQWNEITVDAPAIRLHGRVDMLERDENNNVTVRDFKTGRLLTNDGDVSAHIVLQLRLYGIALLESDPVATIALIASDGKCDYSIDFNSELAESTRAWLTPVLAELPSKATFASRDLANPGQACMTCPHRHICPAYREQAPIWWARGTDAAYFPSDVWGIITAIETTSTTLTLELRDPSERRIRVHRVRPERFTDMASTIGLRVSFFNLSSNTRGTADGRLFGPRNFYEMPSDSSERTAWALAVYFG